MFLLSPSPLTVCYGVGESRVLPIVSVSMRGLGRENLRIQRTKWAGMVNHNTAVVVV